MIKIFLLVLVFSSAVYGHDPCHCSCAGTKPELVFGTNLKTGTFYKVTTEGTDTNHMTWSYRSHPIYGHRYIVSDHHISNIYKYDKGGSRYFDTQWIVLLAKGHTSWYHLTNRGIPGEFAGWSYNSGESFVDNDYYIILDPTYSIDNPKSEYLFRLVKQGDYYQLKIKSLPKAYVGVSGTKEQNNTSRYHLFIDNRPENYVHYQPGGKWFRYTLFKFDQVDDGIKLRTSVSKFCLVNNIIANHTENIPVTQELIATKSIFVNNSTSTLTQEYLARKEISESVFIQRPISFNTFYNVSVEDAVEINGNQGIPFLNTPTFYEQLVSLYSDDQSSKPTRNYTKSLDFYTNQTIEVTRCTEYEVAVNVNIVKDYPIEYAVYHKVTGEQDGEKLTAVELRDNHFNDKGNESGLENDRIEFVDILDEYTVLAKAMAKMWVTFAWDSTVNGKGVQIDSCLEEYVCNQIEN